MTKNIRLIDHRRALADNDEAYTFELRSENISRLVKTLLLHLKKAGYQLTPTNSFDDLSRIIQLLFEAQEKRPFFHVEGTELPLCWNSPKDWDKTYLKYEWGHLRSKNQSPEKAHQLENLGLYSARCNQHIQTSMHIEELMVYGGILAQRISNVLTARRRLFQTAEWRQLVEKLVTLSA
jgi:hypothetical protein